jgi:hypothetical protein
MVRKMFVNDMFYFTNCNKSYHLFRNVIKEGKYYSYQSWLRNEMDDTLKLDANTSYLDSIILNHDSTISIVSHQ